MTPKKLETPAKAEIDAARSDAKNSAKREIYDRTTVVAFGLLFVLLALVIVFAMLFLLPVIARTLPRRTIGSHHATFQFRRYFDEITRFNLSIFMSLSSAEIWTRFALAAALTTGVCLPLAWILLKISGVPPTYPPLLPLQIVSGTVGGALLVTLGYWFLSALIRDQKLLNLVFFALGILLLIASFHLPYRLSTTKSLRFTGVTVAAQIGQALLHTNVVVLSMICFLRR